MNEDRDPHDQYERATRYIGKVLQVMLGRFPSKDLELLLILADSELDDLYAGLAPDADRLEWRKRADAICRTPDDQLLAGYRVPHETPEYKT